MKKVILEFISPAESMASFLQSWKFGKLERNTRIDPLKSVETGL